ncbi:succinyl-diaminopimelate desuccinylase [Prosthecobacter fusiformis]|uniref:Succinyl-diaminopimelate desuccinylase n=1 Tax=Prosthecobacter fusiformis TaxID=48464 RepID=A0A4R7RUC6_9BACT|nr:M20 family metallopeptidase [Prosthecobacter fusiformis]TDU68037.1 succinyl-diaminopimelate desuccinylase [Prosthecobacter fusiformis]
MSFSSPLLERLVALTRDLILIPSTDTRPHERARCFAFLRDHLEAVDGVCIREFESDGYGSLVASPMGAENPEILMVAHLDVIDHPDMDVYRSSVRDGRIYGPGAGDMKGQVAIMVELFCQLQRQYPGLSFGLAITSDEEIGGHHGVKHLFERMGLRCGVAIVPDGGSINDITVAEKGILHARLSCQGKEGHAARPWLTPNALLYLTEAVVRVTQDMGALKSRADITDDHWYPTCVPTVLRTANQTLNCIPGEAYACLDIRFPYPLTVVEMLDQVRQSAGAGIEVEELMSAPPTQLAPDPLYLQITYELTQQPVNRVRASGGSDARFISQHGIPVILSRPLVGSMHSPEEWIDIESMGLYYRICEEFILRKLGLR